MVLSTPWIHFTVFFKYMIECQHHCALSYFNAARIQVMARIKEKQPYEGSMPAWIICATQNSFFYDYLCKLTYHLWKFEANLSYSWVDMAHKIWIYRLRQIYMSLTVKVGLHYYKCLDKTQRHRSATIFILLIISFKTH